MKGKYQGLGVRTKDTPPCNCHSWVAGPGVTYMSSVSIISPICEMGRIIPSLPALSPISSPPLHSTLAALAPYSSSNTAGTPQPQGLCTVL